MRRLACSQTARTLYSNCCDAEPRAGNSPMGGALVASKSGAYSTVWTAGWWPKELSAGGSSTEVKASSRRPSDPGPKRLTSSGSIFCFGSPDGPTLRCRTTRKREGRFTLTPCTPSSSFSGGPVSSGLPRDRAIDSKEHETLDERSHPPRGTRSGGPGVERPAKPPKGYPTGAVHRHFWVQLRMRRDAAR